MHVFLKLRNRNSPDSETTKPPRTQCGRKFFGEKRSMYRRDTSNYARSFPVVECAQCGEALFAPEWSEHVDDRRVRHAWNCEACRYCFETTVWFPALESA
jgi:hypothetical protein